VVDGFLTKFDGRYGLAPDAALFLNRRSPAYLGGAAIFMTSDEILAAFASHRGGAPRRHGARPPGYAGA
jgi:hypothetical protein